MRSLRLVWFVWFFAIAACGGGDTNNSMGSIDLSTRQGLFQLTLTTEPDPPVVGMNTVDLRITTAATGEPLTGAFVKVRPYMPAHGHGSNTQPNIVEIEPGHFRAERVELQMSGPWELQIDIETIDTGDTVVHPFEVP